MPFEAGGVPAYGMRDALTCDLLWQGPNTASDGEGPGRGVAGDVDPSSPGAEAWVSGGGLCAARRGRTTRVSPNSTTSSSGGTAICRAKCSIATPCASTTTRAAS